MKFCSKCKIDRPLSEFYRDSSAPSGYAYSCKDCVRLYYLTRVEVVREYGRKYRIKNYDKQRAQDRAASFNRKYGGLDSAKKYPSAP